MKQEFKYGRGGSYYKGFMEWQCCGQTWQLQIWRGQPERREWRAECDVCGKVGLAYSQFTLTKEVSSMAKETQKGASLKPSEFATGGGLIQGDLTWRNPRFEMFDYGGSGPSTPAFALDLEPEEGDTATQYWSVGNPQDWAPSKDGNKIVPIGKATNLSKSSNFYQLLNSLVEGGYPEDQMEDDVSVYEGLKCHMIRIPAPERRGLTVTKKESKYEKDILVVDKVLEMPGETKGTAKGSKGADDEASTKATEIVMEILGENPKGINRMKLAGEIFKRLKAEKMEQGKVNSIVQLVGGKDESFLQSGPWNYDSKKGELSQ